MTLRAQAKKTPEREAFYRDIAVHHMTPLWEVFTGMITPEPRSDCRPVLWRYRDIRPAVIRAGELISAEEAERRVLVLENPGLKGTSGVTTSLYAGIQLVNPGEIAPAHRHSQSALRFIIEGEGGYTAVGEERTIMHEGDFVITPSWAWHAHGNEGDGPVIWLDGLDIPMVSLLDASFMEFGEDKEHPTPRPTGDALARYGSGLLPVDHEAPRGRASPVFNYPYARTREALEQMRRLEEWDPCHGLKLKYVNPETGDYAMPSIGTFIQLLPKGFASAQYRSSDATVFHVIEGEGRVTIAEESFAWTAKDTFVVPSWHPYRFEAAGDAVLFSFSDRPVQQKLGIWREDRGNA